MSGSGKEFAATLAEAVGSLWLVVMYPLLALGMYGYGQVAAIGVAGGFAALGVIMRRPGMAVSNVWALAWSIAGLARLLYAN